MRLLASCKGFPIEGGALNHSTEPARHAALSSTRFAMAAAGGWAGRNALAEPANGARAG